MRNVDLGFRIEKRKRRNDRGVALIIVLLVTALLIALIFEFAYGTRISLRSAVNFRDSQRAYFLARSGVNFVNEILSDNLKNNRLQDNLEQLEWQTLPVMTGADAELRVRWEDEGGKINIGSVFAGNLAYMRLSKLFDVLAISQAQLDRTVEGQKNFYLITELHRFLSDDDFWKLKDFVTVGLGTTVNVNTASREVLRSLGLSAGMAEMLVERRKKEPFKNPSEVNAFLGPDNTMIAGQLTVTSDVFKVDSLATVGGYTKLVKAVITRSISGYKVNYWSAL